MATCVTRRQGRRHTHVSAACVRRKKNGGRAAGAREQLVEAVICAFSTSTSLLVKACLLTHQGHMRACAVGVKGRGAAVEVRRQCSTSVDDVSTAPLCGRDAATRGAEFEADSSSVSGVGEVRARVLSSGALVCEGGSRSVTKMTT